MQLKRFILTSSIEYIKEQIALHEPKRQVYEYIMFMANIMDMVINITLQVKSMNTVMEYNMDIIMIGYGTIWKVMNILRIK